MDFAFTEEQATITKVARELFGHRVTPERLTELEADGVNHDAGLWSDLAKADLLGIALPESVGGSGGGFLELGLLLAEVGYAVAPAPVYATLLLGADPVETDHAIDRLAARRQQNHRHVVAAHAQIAQYGKAVAVRR